MQRQFSVVTGRIRPPKTHTEMTASGTSAAPQMKAGANVPDASIILGMSSVVISTPATAAAPPTPASEPTD